MLVYLGICAVIAFLTGLLATVSTVPVLVQYGFAVPPAPTIHIFFAAGAMPLIFGAIIHFVPVLTRSGIPIRAIQLLPLPVQLAGVITPLALAGVLPYWTLHLAAVLAAGAALVLFFWATRRMRTTLGMPHPGTRWYGASLLCLFLAVSLVPVWLALPGLRPALRLFHLHLNTLGFIGLAALGTLPVLLPTALGKPEGTVAKRLLDDLLPAMLGAILVAAGAASSIWLALPGAFLLLWVMGRNLLAWWHTFGMREIVGAGATAPMATASGGFLLLLIAGIAHGAGWLAPRPILSAYAALFLMPLVTGALTQLLPVWRFPGRASLRREHLSAHLARGGPSRAALFFCGGILLLFDFPAGMLFIGAGLASFAVVLVWGFWLDRHEASDDNPRPVP